MVALPDGRWLVVDACFEHRSNLTADLLQHFGATSVDLLVLTHPDLDHLRGASTLLASAVRLWPWPHHGSIRRIAAMAAKRKGDKNYLELQRLLDDLAVRVAEGLRLGNGGVGKPDWPEETNAQYQVISLAPNSYDLNTAGSEVDRIVEEGLKYNWVAAQALLDGIITSGEIGDRPNRLSKAVVILWGSHRVLLAGDVENGLHARSGWRGIIDELSPTGNESDRRDLLRALTLVKIAHHGSSGAFLDDAWDLHCSGGSVARAVVAPFSRGNVKAGYNPPSVATLTSLRKRVQQLAVTATAGDAQDRAVASGWTATPTTRARGRLRSPRWSCRLTAAQRGPSPASRPCSRRNWDERVVR